MGFPFKQTLATKNVTPGKNTKQYIVMHHTGTYAGTVAGVLKTLTTGAVSCHFVVDQNGDAYKIGEPDNILWHAGVSEWNGLKDMNKYSLGIEFVGIDSFTDIQKATGKKLVEHLMAAFNIPKENVIRHADIAPGRKTDINLNFILPLKKWSDYQNTLTPKIASA